MPKQQQQPVAGPSRPRSSLNAPATSAPPRPALSAFSPSRTQFALAHPALGSADKVSAWNIVEDRLVAEWEIEGASKATSITWTTVSGAGSHGKKRRKRDAAAEAVVITTTKGQVFVWSPTDGVLSKFDLPSAATASTSSEHGVVLASATAVHVLSPDNASFVSTSLPAGTPAPSAVAVLPSSTPDSLHIVIASSSAIVLHITSSQLTRSTSALPVSTSSTLALHTLSSPQPSFLVVSDDDRTVSQYTISNGEPRLSYRYASPTLSNAHSVSSSATHLSVLHASGEISLFPLPTELDLTRPKSDGKPHAVRFVEGKADKQARICRACVLDDSVIAGRMMGGGRVKWVKAAVGGDVRVQVDAQDLVQSNKEGKLQRFSAPTLQVEEDAEDVPVHEADLPLGERLLSANGGIVADDENEATVPEPRARATVVEHDGPVTAASLTRLMVQALHTSDPALLSMCLTHRDPVLIRNTIRKMPTQLALPLLKACVERLGQGKGAQSRGGGRGVAQNEQQGRGTVEWVKGVLVERGAVLMTMPSLPAHLGALSRLLDQRLQLYQPLLSLSGRLDLALAQVAMRRVALEQAGGGKGEPVDRYVEGESDDEEESEDEEVEVEYGEEGEVEDVNMLNGVDSEEDDSDDDEDDEDVLDSDDEELLDLEAGESDEEDEEGDSDED